MSKSIIDRVNRLPEKPLGFLAVQLAIVTMAAVDLSLLLVTVDLSGGQDYGWPFIIGGALSLGLLGAAVLVSLLDLWVIISLLEALRPGSGARQRLRGRLPALALLGLVTCGAFYGLFASPFPIMFGGTLICSTALIGAYELISAPRLTPGLLVRGLGLLALMVLILWKPVQAAFG
jgi:hypothetical protein